LRSTAVAAPFAFTRLRGRGRIQTAAHSIDSEIGTQDVEQYRALRKRPGQMKAPGGETE